MSNLVVQAAKEALKDANQDVRKATEILERNARADDALYRALTEPTLHQAAWSAITQQASAQRTQYWSAPKVTARSSGASVLASARVAASWYDYLLPETFVKLGDAKWADHMRAATYYRVQGTTSLRRATFHEEIAKALGENSDAVTRDVLEERDIVRIAKAAEVESLE